MSRLRAPNAVNESFDVIVVGGGLQAALLVLAARAHAPSTRIAIVERAATLGGNHTWCFHAGDLSVTAQAWIAPLVDQRWSGYTVAFPRYRRWIDASYAAISSSRVDRVIRGCVPMVTVFDRATAMTVAPHRVTVSDASGSRTLDAGLVVDARGPDHSTGVGGYQKFVGLELVLTAPHGLTEPTLMDATVPQTDGYRFFYVLPLAPDRLLIEDTYFSDHGFLDLEQVRAEILAYAERHRFVGTVVRTESGVLSLPWQLAVSPPSPGLIVAGYQGGWFHPVTGYSLPIAARLAETIARGLVDGDPVAAVAALAQTHSEQLGFACRLVWMMFKWFPPTQRFGVLEHFYRLPVATIGRFYALALTRSDRARFFLRRPPRGLSWRALFTGGAAAEAS
jgi:lycopene beta-cyclase